MHTIDSMAPEGSHDGFAVRFSLRSSHDEFSLIFIPFLFLCELSVVFVYFHLSLVCSCIALEKT